mmetsp:Transcript_29637/g.38141  ORF Transcript_29637/g.38141 Transcript_29637/m.38141 type:complete len:80 (-) Transcript_29637:290-529(-)
MKGTILRAHPDCKMIIIFVLKYSHFAVEAHLRLFFFPFHAGIEDLLLTSGFPNKRLVVANEEDLASLRSEACSSTKEKL